MVQLMKQGHREIDEIDDTLARAERIAHDTLDIGTQVWRKASTQMVTFPPTMMVSPFPLTINLTPDNQEPSL